MEGDERGQVDQDRPSPPDLHGSDRPRLRAAGRALSQPQLWRSETPLPSIPEGAQQYAHCAAQLALADILAARVTCIWVFTFRGTTLWTWQLRDVAGAQVDDLARKLGEGADAVGVLARIPPPPGADVAFLVAIECATGRHDTAIAVKAGAPPAWQRGEKPYPEGAERRWLGVPPVAEVDVWMEGPVGAVIDGGEA